MSRIKIVFDGRTLQSGEYSADIISVKKSIDAKKDATNEFTFYKQAYQEIKSSIIGAPLGQSKSIPLKVYDLCCGDEVLVFDGEIQGKSVEWCDDECYAKAVATEVNPLLDCLKGQILSEGLESISHPNIPMHRDLSDFEQVVADVLQILLFGLLALLLPALAAILLFLTVVEAVIQGIDILLDTLRKIPLIGNVIPDIIPGDDRDILPDISDIDDIYADLKNIIKKIDQVYYYPSPYVRVMLENACNQCGIRANKSFSFYSDILNQQSSDYYNLVYLKATGRGSTSPKSIGIIESNKPVVTAEDLLDDLATVFNARWYTDGNTLYFESRYAKKQGRIDFTQSKACYSFPNEDLYARLSIDYTDDPIDTTSNTQQDKFDHIEEFNTSNNPLLRGKKKNVLPFGRWLIERFRGKFSANSTLMLKMSQRSCAYPKLMIFAQGKLINDARLYGHTLFNKFFFNENPLSSAYKSRVFDIQETLDCGKKPSPGQEVATKHGVGTVQEVEYDYSNRVITISGII